jgi:hypothetical protein
MLAYQVARVCSGIRQSGSFNREESSNAGKIVGHIDGKQGPAQDLVAGSRRSGERQSDSARTS